MENEIKHNVKTLCDQPEENRIADDRLPDASGGMVPFEAILFCRHCGHQNGLGFRTCEKCGRPLD